MQPLYAIRFDVIADSDAETPAFQSVIDLITTWVTRRSASSTPLNFVRSGECAFKLLNGDSRELSWQRIDTDTLQALRVDQIEERDDYVLYTRITTTWSSPDRATFRLRLGIAGKGQIVPTDLPGLRPPAIVGQLLGSRRVTCQTVDHQQIDNRYVMVKQPVEAELFAHLLENEARLPLIILNTAQSGTWSQMEKRTIDLAREVSGLARVVCLAFHQGLNRFREIRPELTPDAGRALLIWPSRRLEPERFDVEDALSASQLMDRLLRAAVSVFGGRDEGWTVAQKALRELEQQALRAELAGATDVESVRAAAAAQVSSIEAGAAAEREVYSELLADSDHRVREYELQVDTLITEKLRLTAKLEALQYSRRDLTGEEFWSADAEIAAIPGFDLRSMADVLRLLDRLEQVSQGAFVVTDNARQVCIDGDYPDPPRMAEQLIRLTSASIEYRSTDGVLGKNLHDWLELRGLVNSTLDDSLQREKLHLFEFEERVLDRTPHVKIDDSTHPNKVGRIYFAADQNPPNERARFVVDHIGQKLYLKEGKRIRKGRD